MTTLYPFQTLGSYHLASRFRGLNADDPGLGKTLQAIAAVELVGARTVLVVCPASVRSSWREHTRGAAATYTIISYNGASYIAVREALAPHYDVGIFDEIHFCKNMESQRTQAIFGAGEKGLARRCDYIWPLTGTWAPNGRPIELYPVLRALHPAFADMSFAAYANRYCGAFWDGRGFNAKGATRLEELAQLLRQGNFMLRRTENEAFPERLDPLVERVPIDLTPEDLAGVIAAEDEIVGGREARVSATYEKFSAMGDTARLQRLLGLAKVPHVLAYVDELLEGGTPKVVLFAHHLDVIEAFRARYSGECVVYRGGMSDAGKDAVITAFGTSGVRVFIAQDQAAGTGINGLQRIASRCVFAEPSWTPGDTFQRIRRLQRIGQTDPLVKADLMYAVGTLDEVVVGVHDRKERTGERLLDAPVTPASRAAEVFA